ncbi:LysE family translocator [Tabrizicola soli]|uniref:LysE family translocator n=1 Tax=Tabrizicola soli TaxID=2185115 RepID=A0ABV7DQG9_9RHOB
MGADSLTSFLLAALVLELTPGPNMTWLALLTATAGRRVGLAALTGIALGLALQAVLAVVGVAALMAAWPGLYRVLHLAGVGFLLFLAWESWRDSGDPAHHRPGGGEDGAAGFRRGLVANLLNPKAALFFVTVLPGFLPQAASAGAALALSAVYVALATAVHLVIVLAAGSLGGWLADPAVSVRMHRIQALALVLVAVWLFWRG